MSEQNTSRRDISRRFRADVIDGIRSWQSLQLLRDRHVFIVNVTRNCRRDAAKTRPMKQNIPDALFPRNLHPYRITFGNI